VKLQGYTDSDWAKNVVDRKKHIKMLLQFGIRYDLMVEKKTIVNGTQYSRDIIYNN
jgi:hypothetical protein